MLLNGLKSRIDELSKQEAGILKAGFPLPVPAVVRGLIVYYLPNKFFQETKQQLFNRRLEKTKERIKFIKTTLKEIQGLSNNQEIIASIDSLLNQELKSDDQLKKWDIRWATRDLKALRKTIETDFSSEQSINLLEKLKNVRSVLGDEFEDRATKLRDISEINDQKYYIKQKTDYKDLPAPYRFFFWFRQGHKTLNAIFTLVSFVAVTISFLALLFFPTLGPIAIILTTIVAITLAYGTIMLASERFTKWATDRVYFDLPFSKTQAINALIGIYSIALGLIFAVAGISALLPATGTSTGLNFSMLGNGLNNFINGTMKFFTSLTMTSLIDIADMGYLVAMIGMGTGYFRDLSRSLIGMYQNNKAAEASPEPKLNISPQIIPIAKPKPKLTNAAKLTIEPEVTPAQQSHLLKSKTISTIQKTSNKVPPTKNESIPAPTKT
jgi:hypothetical protein